MRSKICVSEIQSFMLMKRVKCLIWIKQDKLELWQPKVTVASVAVVTTKFLSGMYDCTADSEVGTGDSLLVLGIPQMCGHAHVRSHVSPGMDCKICCLD